MLVPDSDETRAEFWDHCVLSERLTERVCLQMAETGFGDKISDSDYERYFNGNPYYCYYFRKAEEKVEVVIKAD